MVLMFDMAEENDKSQSTHQSPNIGNSGGNTRLFNNSIKIDHHTTTNKLTKCVDVDIDLPTLSYLLTHEYRNYN